MDQRDVAVGQRERDAGRHQRPLPRRQRHVDGGHQVGAGVAGMGVRRERQVGVEALQQHLELGGCLRAAGWRRSGASREPRAVTLPAGGAGPTPTMHPVENAVALPYAERLAVPLRWWVQGTMLVASLWLAVVVALPGALAWSISAVALALVVGPAAGLRLRPGDGRRRRAPRRPRPDRRRAPRRGDRRSTRTRPAGWPGVDADARAYLLLRPYLKRAVRVEITDPADPTPYWLVSTRHPDRLAEAVTTLTRSGAAG